MFRNIGSGICVGLVWLGNLGILGYGSSLVKRSLIIILVEEILTCSYVDNTK